MACCTSPQEFNDQPSSTFIETDWMPLDELTQAFGSFGAEATSALALQAVGTAFCALAFETSAHKHYTLAYHGLWGHIPATIVQGLEQADADLTEAIHQWGTLLLWFERLGAQEPSQMETLRARFDPLIYDHQQHLWSMQMRVRHELAGMRTRLAMPVVAAPLSQKGGTPA